MKQKQGGTFEHLLWDRVAIWLLSDQGRVKTWLKHYAEQRQQQQQHNQLNVFLPFSKEKEYLAYLFGAIQSRTLARPKKGSCAISSLEWFQIFAICVSIISEMVAWHVTRFETTGRTVRYVGSIPFSPYFASLSLSQASHLRKILSHIYFSPFPVCTDTLQFY